MTKRTRIGASIAVLVLAVGAWVNDTSVEPARVAPASTSAELATIGPLTLINNEYSSRGLSCDADDAVFTTLLPWQLWPALDTSIGFSSAAASSNVGWDASAIAAGGQLIFSAVKQAGTCIPGEAIASVTGTLSNGEDFSITFVAS